MKRYTIFDDSEFIRQKSIEVDFKSDDIQSYIEKLKEYCSMNVVYALSPVQIGIPKRIIYIKNSKETMAHNNDSQYDESIIYINPRIISAMGHTEFLEGCESVSYMEGDIRIYQNAIVRRPYKIEIEYYDLFGKKKRKELEGFECTVFCHEYDHLNGIIHLDRALDTFIMKTDEVRAFRENNPYKIIDKDEPYLKVEEI